MEKWKKIVATALPLVIGGTELQANTRYDNKRLDKLFEAEARKTPDVVAYESLTSDMKSYPKFQYKFRPADSFPLAYTEMCQRIEREVKAFKKSPEYKIYCEKRSNAYDEKKAIFLDQTIFTKLYNINQSVNNRITPVEDQKKHGKLDVWEYKPVTTGDCDEYVLTKYRRLILESGINPQSLFLAVVKHTKEDGKEEGHLVLLVEVFAFNKDGKIEPRFLVLDNLKNDIAPIEARGDLELRIINDGNHHWFKTEITR